MLQLTPLQQFRFPEIQFVDINYDQKVYDLHFQYVDSL